MLRNKKNAIVKDAKKVQAKASPGEHRAVYGKYREKRGGYTYLATHIVDELGNVKLSYFRGADGDRYLAAGKDYVNKHLNLDDFFYNTKNLNIEYDVYN